MKKKKKGKERKKPRWRERGRSGGRRRSPCDHVTQGLAGAARAGLPAGLSARACVRLRAHPSSGTPRAAQAEQVGKSVRLARAGRTPSLQRSLPGAQTRLAPRRRGRTCRTRRSTFLKAVRPPYVAQCPRGLPAAGQWPSARVPSPSAAGCPRPRPGGDCPGARRPPGQPTQLSRGAGRQPSPPSSFLFGGSPSLLLSLSPFSFLFHPFLLPLSPASPSSF